MLIITGWKSSGLLMFWFSYWEDTEILHDDRHNVSSSRLWFTLCCIFVYGEQVQLPLFDFLLCVLCRIIRKKHSRLDLFLESVGLYLSPTFWTWKPTVQISKGPWGQILLCSQVQICAQFLNSMHIWISMISTDSLWIYQGCTCAISSVNKIM